MLDFSQHPDKASLRLLVLHDDAEREFDYTSGAEEALAKAGTDGWTGCQHQERLEHRLLRRRSPQIRRPRGIELASHRRRPMNVDPKPA